MPLSVAASRLFSCRRESPGRRRLFAFHHAGGGGDVFRCWADLLPRDIESWNFDLPGHGRRFGEPPARSIPDLADELAGAIAPLLDLPYAFFGFSLGARIAFELTRRLEERGARPPERLFVAADVPPDQRPNRRLIWELDEAEFAGWIRHLEGTPRAILDNQEMMDFFLPIFRADFELYDSYAPPAGARVAAPITALCGTTDAVAPPAVSAGWWRSTSGRFRLVTLDAGHFLLQTHTTQVVAEIERDLAEAGEARPAAETAAGSWSSAP